MDSADLTPDALVVTDNGNVVPLRDTQEYQEYLERERILKEYHEALKEVIRATALLERQLSESAGQLCANQRIFNSLRQVYLAAQKARNKYPARITSHKSQFGG